MGNTYKSLIIFKILILNLLIFQEGLGCLKKLPNKCLRPTTVYYTAYGQLPPPRICQRTPVPPNTLIFEKGDVIRCFMGYVVGYHFMLATSPTTVIHISGVQNKNDAKITEESILTATKSYKDCSLYTDCMDCDIWENDRSIMPYSAEVAVNNGRKMMSVEEAKVYYDLLYCNCEHWVAYWRYGKAYSAQGQVGGWSIGKTNSKCRI